MIAAGGMDKAQAIAALQANKQAIIGLGIDHIAVFGSTARGEARPDSDLDLAATLNPEQRIGILRLVEIEQRIAEMLGTKVDLITEPVRKPSLQQQLDRDRIDVF